MESTFISVDERHSGLLTQARQLRVTLLLILTVATFLIGTALFLHFAFSIPVFMFTRDPVSIGKLPPYAGFLSQSGIFFWASAAAICLFTAAVLSHTADNVRIRNFLVFSGLITLLLGLDDLFLLHEKVFPFAGMPQNAVFLSYGGCLLFYLIKYHSIILKTDFMLLGLALACFGLSLIMDVLQPKGPGIYPLYEDGAKLVGIVSWLAYFFRTGTSLIRSDRLNQRTAALK